MTTIVTLAMDPEVQKWFDEQRKAYFPPALNHIPAHLTLFHRLPGDAATGYVLKAAAEREPPFSMLLDGVASMGRGVTYTLASPELLRLHGELAGRFASYLTPQDKQVLRPHVVVQNKVEPHEARALLAQLQAGFVLREVAALGLEWWEYLGGRWRWIERFEFAASRVQPGVSAPVAEVNVLRLSALTDESMGLLEEYFEAVGVVQRSSPEEMRRLVHDPKSGFWIARKGSEAAGCVVLKAGVPDAAAGECKRLYVRAAYRRSGIAETLMDALEESARRAGLNWVYLDSKDDLAAAVALYRGRGYVECERYNNNPQATMFFRKRL